jgi:nucleotide-binding universal stress UspA family protein
MDKAIDMDDKPTINVIHAIQDFHSARQKATLREIMARLRGESTELLSYGEVRQKLRAQVGTKRELKEIPISAIIGSVNRYQDFSRGFLPGQNVDEERWANVELATYGMVGWPPIEVYQINEVYFVSDGNHRVSVARQLGIEQIQAYVIDVHTRVPLTPDIRPEDLILMSEYTDFLEHTNLDQIRPSANLSVTVPGQYPILEEHISVHRYFMGIEQNHEIQYSEAVADWYDEVYLPVVEIIQEHGLLKDFPGRTETDLYLWIAEHRADLEKEVNTQVEVTSAVDDLADQFSQRPYRQVARLGNKIVRALMPNFLDAGPAPGEWRQSIERDDRSERLFNDILVPVNGQEDGWNAVEQAIIIAKREGSQLHGLYITNVDEPPETLNPDNIRDDFVRRCESAGIHGDLQVKSGDIAEGICDRGRWNDLVVMNLSYPPDTSLLGKMSSGIRNMVQRCPRPIMFCPQTTRPLSHALLAYDGSLKAQEALFIAAYLGGQWHIPLAVISIGESDAINDIQGDARTYLEEYGIQAEYIISNDNVPVDIIFDHINQLDIDLLILGGYGHNPILELVQGSQVDEILRRSEIPLLICR